MAEDDSSRDECANAIHKPDSHEYQKSPRGRKTLKARALVRSRRFVRRFTTDQQRPRGRGLRATWRAVGSRGGAPGLPPLPCIEPDRFELEQHRRILQAKLFGADAANRIAQYELQEEIGRGGMGVVHVAWDHDLERKVAMKRLQSTRDPEHRRCFAQEAKALAQLSHPNVVSVYEICEHRGTTFIVMEYIEGVTLGVWLRRRKRKVREILEVFIAAGKGLQGVHARGLVHRDFKPANVMVGTDGRVRVMDLGLACRDPNEASTVPEFGPSKQAAERIKRAGTPAYMAPEQFRGGWVDARCDQFSFCVALYEAVYGHRPSAGSTSGDIRSAPSHSSVPEWIRRVVLRGLEPDPANRFESMEALLASLNAGEQRGVEVKSSSKVYELISAQPLLRRTFGELFGLFAASTTAALLVLPHASSDPAHNDAKLGFNSWLASLSGGSAYRSDAPSPECRRQFFDDQEEMTGQDELRPAPLDPAQELVGGPSDQETL